MAGSSFLKSTGVFNTSLSKLKLYIKGPLHELLGFVGKDLLRIQQSTTRGNSSEVLWFLRMMDDFGFCGRKT